MPRIAQAAGEPTVDVNNPPTYTNRNANVTELDFQNAPVTVNFALSADNANQVTVHYSTGAQGDTATKDVDYVDQSGDIVFAPHEMSKNVVFNAKGDTIDENDEFFTINIDSVTNSGNGNFVKGAPGKVTIQDNDLSPTASLAGKTDNEGTGGTKAFTFTARLSAPAGSDKTYYAFTEDPSGPDTDSVSPGVQPPRAATPGPDFTNAATDYIELNGAPVTFKAGTTTATVDVPINPDTRDEPDEWFDLRLKATNDENASSISTVQGHIQDDDLPVRIDVSDPPAVQEPDTPCNNTGQPACTTFITFTVSLSAPSDQRIVVDYGTDDRTATSGANDNTDDYTATSGSGDPDNDIPPGHGLVFNPGDPLSQQVQVPIRGDTQPEPDEYFAFDLSNPVNATIGDGEAIGLIQNDDGGTFPTVRVGDAPDAAESSGGTPGTSTFTVTVDRPLITCNCPAATADVRVFYQTADGPDGGTGAKAVAGSDYVAKTGFVDVNYPNTTGSVPVSLINDSKHEPDEFFQLQLTGASNSAITDAIGQAKITDDDPIPTVSIADKTVTEGNTGNNPPTKATMTVTLSAASGDEVDVPYSTPQPNSGTATVSDDGKDYVPVDSILVFNPGETSKTFDIDVIGDTTDEPNETVAVQLGTPTNANINRGAATLTITDDDPLPTIGIGNVTVTEGSSGNSTASFPVVLSAASSKPITVHVATDPGSGTATEGTDYTATAGDLTFNPGEKEKDFDVPVIGDTLDEANETFTATISSPNANATLGNSKTGTATIQDDDDGPTLAINDATVTEGNTGTTNATFTVTKTGTTTQTVTAHYATADGTATQPADYTATSGDLTFAPNETTKTIVVPVKGDTNQEADETFTVVLSALTNASSTDDTGTGTITNDDGVPTVGVGNATCSEGDKCTFTLTLSGASQSDVTVNYSTADGTAKAATDYTAVPAGTATITAGQTTKTVDVQTTEDTTHESQETFTLTLDSATGAAVDTAHKTGTGTINDDDAAPTAPQVTTGAGPGGGPHIQSFPAGSSTATVGFMDGTEGTGKRVARGDVDGDGVDEIITGSGPNSAAVVSVYSATGQLRASTFAYAGGRFYGGVFVAAGDLDHDGKDEIITGAGPGGGPHVIVWKVSGQSLNPVGGGYFAYGPDFHGGVTVASADVNGDGNDDIITGPGAGGGPDVEANSFSVANAAPTRLFGFMAYTDPNAQPNWTGGINVAAGDFDGDGKAEIAVVPWNGGGPHLRTFNHDGTLRNGGIFAGNPGFTGGLTVAVGDLTGDGKAEIIVGAWSSTNAVKGYNADLSPMGNEDFRPYGNFGGGDFVAVGKA